MRVASIVALIFGAMLIMTVSIIKPVLEAFHVIWTVAAPRASYLFGLELSQRVEYGALATVVLSVAQLLKRNGRWGVP